jgi:hypothetical protein
MHSELVKLILIDDDAAIRVLNQHAIGVSSRYKKVSEAYEESFESFLKALDGSGYSRVCFDEPNSDLTMSYWHFSMRQNRGYRNALRESRACLSSKKEASDHCFDRSAEEATKKRWESSDIRVIRGMSPERLGQSWLS